MIDAWITVVYGTNDIANPLCVKWLIILTPFVGDVNAAIDFYSKGVAELEKGVSYHIHAKGLCLSWGACGISMLWSVTHWPTPGEELAKAMSIKSKMEKNLEMAKERVADLCEC